MAKGNGWGDLLPTGVVKNGDWRYPAPEGPPPIRLGGNTAPDPGLPHEVCMSEIPGSRSNLDLSPAAGRRGHSHQNPLPPSTKRQNSD